MAEEPARGRVRMVVAGLIALVGVIWIGQGIGLIGGSFMTGDATWAFIGAGAVVIALLIAEPWRRT